jgi:hypothetical protein
MINIAFYAATLCHPGLIALRPARRRESVFPKLDRLAPLTAADRLKEITVAKYAGMARVFE